MERLRIAKGTDLCVLIHAVGKSAADVFLALKKTGFDGCDGEVLVSMREELEGGEACRASANDCNLHVAFPLGRQ